MLVLGIDTSGKNGSVALVDCTPETCRTVELVPLEGGTFSAQLVPQIAALLQKHGFTKHQIDAFAVVTGPGSFTGLRVGLAAVKALAEILQKPVVAMSLLEAVARITPVFVAGVGPDVLQEGHPNGQVFPYTVALDAGRGEVFIARWQVTVPKGARRGEAISLEESVMTLEELAGLTRREKAPWVVTPDDVVAVALRERLQSPQLHGIFKMDNRPQADMVARVGFRKLQAGQTVTPEALDATYLRRSEAEIKFAGRTK